VSEQIRNGTSGQLAQPRKSKQHKIQKNKTSLV